MGGSGQSTIIDLTKSLDASFIPYTDGQYVDPPLEFSDWSTLAKEGFRVTRFALGTQSGTHIDAPAHFLSDGAGLEALRPEDLIGDYFILNLSRQVSSSEVIETLRTYQGESILFLRTPENQTVQITSDALLEILSLPPLLILLSGEIIVINAERFAFYRFVARQAKFLVEDLDQRAAHRISGQGEAFVFPLKLVGVSGSPCRVMVRSRKAENLDPDPALSIHNRSDQKG